jgi:hypothetical protein
MSRTPISKPPPPYTPYTPPSRAARFFRPIWFTASVIFMLAGVATIALSVASEPNEEFWASVARDSEADYMRRVERARQLGLGVGIFGLITGVVMYFSLVFLYDSLISFR